MRIEQLTFTRFVAALAIVVFHDGQDIFPFYLPGLKTVFQNAYAGVSYFFILSGFVMVVAYSRKGAGALSYRTFYTHRFARIYPAYFVALMMVVFLFLVSGKGVEIVSFVSSLFLVQAWIPGYAATLNVPGWSLSVEFFFYLVFPFLFNSFYRTPQSRTVMVVVVLVLWVITQAVSIVGVNIDGSPAVHMVLYYHPLLHINEFLIGNVAAILFLHFQDATCYGQYDWGILGIMAALVLFILNNPGLNVHNGLLAVFIVPFIVCLSYNTGFLTRLFVRPSFALLGEISYGIYIYQKPVRYYLYKFYAMTGMTQKEFCFYGFLGALILFSYGSYRFIEQPLRRMIQGRLKQRMVASPPNVNIQ